MGHSQPRKTTTRAWLSLKSCSDRRLPRRSRRTLPGGTTAPMLTASTEGANRRTTPRTRNKRGRIGAFSGIERCVEESVPLSYLVLRLGLVQFGEDLDRQAGVPDVLAQLLDRREAIIGHLLLVDLQKGRHVAVGPALDPQKLHHLQPRPVALLLPGRDHLRQPPRQGGILQLLLLLAARHARGSRVGVELLVQHVAGAVRDGPEGMSALPAQLIGQLVGGDGEQIGLQLAAVVKVGQAVEEADEGLLNDVLAGGAVPQTAFDKGQQPALVTADEMLPGAGVALTDLQHEQAIAFRGHERLRRAVCGFAFLAKP